MSVSVGAVVWATGLLTVAGGWAMVVSGRRRRRAGRLLETFQLSSYRQRLPDFERELNRARRAERQLAIVVLALKNATEEDGAPQQGSSRMERWAYLLVGSMLGDLLRGHDIVAYDPVTDRYILQLTESDRRQATRLIDRIREHVAARTSLELRCGLAQFPEDGLTLQELLRQAGEHCGSWRRHVGVETPDRVRFPSQGRRVPDSGSGLSNSS